MRTAAQNRVIENRQHSVLDLFARSLKDSGVSGQSLRAYTADARRFVSFIARSSHLNESTALAKLTHSDIEAYIQLLLKEDSKYVTVKRHMVTLRKLCSFLVREHFLDTNPVDGLSVGSAHEDSIPTPALVRILEYCQSHVMNEPPPASLGYRRDELILLFMLLYGVRQYQIPLLKLSGIKHSEKGVVLEYPALGEIVLDELIVKLLSGYLTQRNSPAHTIFVEGESAQPVLVSSMRLFWNEITHALGLRCNRKVLHHTHRSLMAQPRELEKFRAALLKLHHSTLKRASASA